MQTVKILSGIPGSGKSHYARGFPDATVCSADDYFMRGGVYDFRPAELPNAHAECLAKFHDAVRAGHEVVIVDNTNVTPWEIAPYYAFAEVKRLIKGNVNVEIIRFTCDPFVAFRRCVHDVPLPVIMRMHRTLLTTELPPHWRVTYEWPQ